MNKLRYLLTESITRKEKIILSVTVGFTLSFTFIFFGMLDIFISNLEDMTISFKPVLGAACAVFFPAWIIISGFLFVLPGKFFSVAASLVAGLIIAGYLQGNVLNNSVQLGRLTGESINWHYYRNHAIVNTIIWIILLLLPLAVRYFASAAVWRRAVLIVCALLIGMQGTALISSLITHTKELQYEPEYHLSRDGTYEVSSTGNIIVFVVDGLNYEYIEAIRESDPGFFDKLDGFTEFTNAAGTLPNTFPAGTYMTTGIMYEFDTSRVEYFDYAWRNSEFISSLQDSGFNMTYHMSEQYMFSDYEQILGIADNVKDSAPIPLTVSIIKNFAKLSAYRYAPMAFKPFFWIPGIAIEMTGEITWRDMVYVFSNDVLFMELLLENGLSIRNDTKKYSYLHLYGSHPPYTINEYAQPDTSSDAVSQTKGVFNILYQYMGEMKDFGVYDDATIVILADHGLDTAHMGFFVKPKGSANTPLEMNNAPVSLMNLIPTILQSEGMDYEAFGESVFDVAQDTDGERILYRYAGTTGVNIYNVIGHIGNTDNWILVKKLDFNVSSTNALPIE